MSSGRPGTIRLPNPARRAVVLSTGSRITLSRGTKQFRLGKVLRDTGHTPVRKWNLGIRVPRILSGYPRIRAETDELQVCCCSIAPVIVSKKACLMLGEYGFVRVRSEDQKEESRIIALTKPKSFRTRHKVEGNQEGVWQMDHTRTAEDAVQGKVREVSRQSCFCCAVERVKMGVIERKLMLLEFGHTYYLPFDLFHHQL